MDWRTSLSVIAVNAFGGAVVIAGFLLFTAAVGSSIDAIAEYMTHQ